VSNSTLWVLLYRWRDGAHLNQLPMWG
jgi:hypothetical protein